ncbi:hypothetical protein ACSVDE_03220 [Pseudalkalibacillus sp. Hm43]|uniref:hypothetical protein n=1 Tax=Pseudalkalibacillus sp. Hm43 TaxID=3450742 RepID=UPI003F4426FA
MKISRLVLLAMVIGSINLGLYAHRMYTTGELGYSITLVVLSLFFIGLTIFGILRNIKLSQSE